MKLLLDSCAWPPSRYDLTVAGHDVACVSDWGSDPGDETILARANAERRVVVTLDKDFGELAVHHGRPYAGIMRLVGVPPRSQAMVCLRVLERYGVQLALGAIVTASDTHERVRPADAEDE